MSGPGFKIVQRSGLVALPLYQHRTDLVVMVEHMFRGQPQAADGRAVALDREVAERMGQ